MPTSADMTRPRKHPILFAVTVLLLSLLSSSLCALVFIVLLQWSLPPTDSAYEQSVLESLGDPSVLVSAAVGAACVALVMFPVALFCLCRRDLVRCGVFSVALSIGYLFLINPLAPELMILSPIVTVAALVFCRSTQREWFIGSARDHISGSAG